MIDNYLKSRFFNRQLKANRPSNLPLSKLEIFGQLSKNCRLNMADLQDMLLFARYYGEANEITERIALPRNNPFDES